jgi:hypothetical protein
MRTLSCAVLLGLITGCTMPTVVPEAKVTEYVPLGEVNFRRHSASFDAVRVRSVNCNLAKRTDGSWGGTFDNRPLDVSVTDTHIRGVDFVMSRADSKPGHTIITGQFQGRIYRFEFADDEALVRTATGSLNFPQRLVGEQVVRYGSLKELELRGEAGNEVPPWPQLVFALMSVFN